MINSYLGCPEQDSNLHASQHSHLKRARLPFRHLGIGVSFLVGQIYGVFGGYAIGGRIFSPLRLKKCAGCALTSASERTQRGFSMLVLT